MFSVITTAYNRKDLLEKAVHSVLNQTFKDFEYFIIDDGSTDGLGEMISGIKDTRIRYIYTEHCGHLSKLRNIGIDKSGKRIITFLDSDDSWEPGYLEKINEIYTSSHIQSVISNATILGFNNKRTLFSKEFIFSIKGNFLKSRLLSDSFVIYPSCFSFRQCQPIMRCDEQMKYGDSDLFIRILAPGNSVMLSHPLVNILKHDQNMTSVTSENPSFITSYSEEFETLNHLRKSNLISLLLYRKTRSRYQYKLAQELLEIKRKPEARKNFIKAFLSFPFNLKAIFKGLLVLIK